MIGHGKGKGRGNPGKGRGRGGPGRDDSYGRGDSGNALAQTPLRGDSGKGNGRGDSGKGYRLYGRDDSGKGKGRVASASAALTCVERSVQETRVVRTGHTERVVKKRPDFDIVLAIDTSSSMAGSPIQQVQHCAQELIVDDFAENSDRVCVLAFNQKVRTIKPLTFKHRLPNGRLLRDSDLQCGGGTALNDAIIEGVRTIHRRSGHKDNGRHTHHPYLVILTDGEDNRSRQSFDDAAKVVRKPKESGFGGESMAHFHVIFITVGRDAPVAKIRSLSHDVPHISHIPAENSSPETIRAAFRDLVLLVKKRLLISTTTTTMVVRGQRGGGA